MSDPQPAGAQSLLESFQLGPSWARSGAVNKEQFQEFEPREREGERGGREGGRFGRGGQERRGRDERGGGRVGERDGRDRRGDGRGDGRGRGFGRRPERRDGWDGERRFDEVRPAAGVRVEIHPVSSAVELIAREIHQYARVYSLFDIAQVLLARRDRYAIRFKVEGESAGPLFRCNHDSSLWLTREEAIGWMWTAPWRGEYYEEQTLEVEPPRGNFRHVARCGYSGLWLGPPNYHGYQRALRQLHRERFSHIPFERYAARVRTEHGEEAVAAWLETMKSHTRYRPVGAGDDEWMTDRGEVERHFARHLFDRAFASIREAEVPGDVAGAQLSPALLESLKLASGHTRKHPAMVIPAVCRMFEQLRLPVFKRDGKLFAGPARPHALAPDIALAERPAEILRWLAERGGAKLADLWNDLLPAGQDAPCELWLADLVWLLRQGNLLLFADDTLLLPGQGPRPRPAGARGGRRPDGAATPVEGGKAAPVGGGNTVPAEGGKRRQRKRRRGRGPRLSILVRRAVEKMNPRQLKKVRGAERVWRHRLAMRALRRAVAEESAAAATGEL